MNRRFLFVAVALAVFGLAAALRPPQKEIHRSEDWLEQVTPTSLDGYNAIPGPRGDKQTYRMPEITYKQLLAYGIVTRVFSNHDKSFDVCVIASNSRLSFHEPTSCFPDQDWKILDRKVVQLQTMSRGAIPLAVMHVQHLGSPPTFAAYTYKGPTGMVPSVGDLYMQWSLLNFVSGQQHEGAFYRFMAIDASTTEDELTKFVADYMDKVKATSGGVL